MNKQKKTRVAVCMILIALAWAFPGSDVLAGELGSAGGWVDVYDGLLQKYVVRDGVRYKAWHANAADLKALGKVVDSIGKTKLAGMGKSEKLAFYLNAYNAWILKKILDDYPTDGPGGGGLFGRGRFFKSNMFTVAGRSASFHSLENEVIRKKFNEPRIHFALNCASASCPPLSRKAFRAATLDASLDRLTRAFVTTNPNGVKISSSGGGKIAVSKIFDWYSDDFKAAGGVVGFINYFRSTPVPKDARVSYQSYRWTLNEAGK